MMISNVSRAIENPVPATDEERDLVRRMRSGDEDAFEEFAAHYIPGLLRFASSRLNDRELARDLVQSIVVKAIERLDTYRGEAPLFTWLFACCRNEIATHFRRGKSRELAAPEEAEASLAALVASPEDVAIGNERDDLVHQTLDHLPPRYASVLEWKYLHGESVNEIAARLAVSSKAAESLLTRSRQTFRTVWNRLTAHGDNRQ